MYIAAFGAILTHFVALRLGHLDLPPQALLTCCMRCGNRGESNDSELHSGGAAQLGDLFG